MKVMILSLVALVAATAALAQETKPAPTPMPAWYNLGERANLTALGGYGWFAGTDGDFTPQTPREFATGLEGTYHLTPTLELVGTALYGVDSKLVVSHLGVRYPFWGKR